MESYTKTQLNTSINTILTSEDIAVTVHRITSDSSIKVLNYYVEPFSNVPLGLLGNHLSLKIKIQKKSTSDPETLSLFLKVIPLNCESQLALTKNMHVFEKESYFFETINSQFLNFKMEQCVPKCYLAKSNFLIMEDLRIQGYTIFGSSDPLFDRFDMIKLAIGTLARFHSCSILTAAHLSQTTNHPVTVWDHYSEGLCEILFNPEMPLWNWSKNVMQFMGKVAEHFGHDSNDLQEGFLRIFDFLKLSPTDFNVVCHGDLWMNNIMFNNTATPPKCLLVDFQVTRYSSIFADISQLMYLNSSKEFRRKHEKELMGYYRSVLEETVRNNNPINEIKVPILEELMTRYEAWRFYGCITATLYFPTILLNSDTLKDTVKSSENFEQSFHEDRSNYLLEYMKDNESVKKKIEEIISEFIEINKNLKKQ